MEQNIEDAFGTYTSTWNTGSSYCGELVNNYVASYHSGNTWSGDLSSIGQRGEYDYNNNIMIGSNIPSGDYAELMSTVVHESSHDLGCPDDNSLGTAYMWESYCVNYLDPWTDGQPPPYPPEPCPGM